MPDKALAELTVSGTLRAGINMSNSLLVTGATPAGDPDGVAPDMARAVAESLGVAVALVPFPSPGEVADAVAADGWDIALIGAEPSRAETIAFSPAYVEIEATYLVRDDAPFCHARDVDRPGVRIAVSARSAYDMVLERSLRHATLMRGKGPAGTVARFTDEGLEALAGLRPALMATAAEIGGLRVLDGQFNTVQQAIGTKPQNAALAAHLREFVAGARADGLVARLIERHGVVGRLQVATG
jgi:polar amino acid transport system substrate-binding protein